MVEVARRLRLGVNIDHVATIRNARGGTHPDPVRAALAAVAAGADGITAHLREDRRHITDSDIERLMTQLTVPLNLEMAATPEMVAIALRHRPHAVCLVPERREERTTEGGLDVMGQKAALREFVAPLVEAGIRVSLFIAPDIEAVQAAHAIGAPVVELHTGAYTEEFDKLNCYPHPPGLQPVDLSRMGEVNLELSRLQHAAAVAASLELECHAGHGLTYDNVAPVAAIPEIRELNIGHFLIGEAIFCGIQTSIRRMLKVMSRADLT